MIGGVRRVALIGAAAVNFARLFLTPVKRNVAPAQVRMVPAW